MFILLFAIITLLICFALFLMMLCNLGVIGDNMLKIYKKIYLNPNGNESFIYLIETIGVLIVLTLIFVFVFPIVDLLTPLASVFKEDKESGEILIKILSGHVLYIILSAIFIYMHKLSYGVEIGENFVPCGHNGECVKVNKYKGYGKVFFNILYIIFINIIFSNSIMFNWFSFNVFLLYLISIFLLFIITFFISKILSKKNRMMGVPCSCKINIMFKNNSEKAIMVQEYNLIIQSNNNVFISYCDSSSGLKLRSVFVKDDIEKIILDNKVIALKNGRWEELV